MKPRMVAALFALLPAASIYQPPAGPGGNVGQGPDSEGDNLGDNEGEPDTPMEDESDDTATAKPVAFLDSDDPDFPTVLAAPNPFNSSTVCVSAFGKPEP